MTGDIAGLSSPVTLVFSLYGSTGNVQDIKSTPITIQKDARNIAEVQTKRIVQNRLYIQLSCVDVGIIYKVRVHLSASNAQSSMFVRRMLIRKRVIGDEIRLPFEMWLDDGALVELPVAWPDVPPMSSTLHKYSL